MINRKEAALPRAIILLFGLRPYERFGMGVELFFFSLCTIEQRIGHLSMAELHPHHSFYLVSCINLKIMLH